jgi:hypothetical protein
MESSIGTSAGEAAGRKDVGDGIDVAVRHHCWISHAGLC